MPKAGDKTYPNTPEGRGASRKERKRLTKKKSMKKVK